MNRLRDLFRSLFGQRAMSGPAAEWGAYPAALPPAAPEGALIYAVGDIHGESALLEHMLEEIRRDAAEHGVGRECIAVFLGDYVDRGADSRGVIDILNGDPLPGFTIHLLMGNHEQAMLDFLESPEDRPEWLSFGGVQTLQSYGVRASIGVVDADRCRDLRDRFVRALPGEHRSFLERLEPMVSYGDYGFVHAGVRAGRRLEDQALEDLLWIREPFLRHRAPFDKVIVHGHTIVPDVELHRNRIAVDTGAYATGVLSAVALSGREGRVLSVS